MDLQPHKPAPATPAAIESLHNLPNKLRLQAIESSIAYLSNTERDRVFCDLIELCDPNALPPHRGPVAQILGRAGLDRLTAARRNRENEHTASRARSIVIRQWTTLDPVIKKVALSLGGIDWPTLAREQLETNPACKAAVAQLLADHAAQSETIAQDRSDAANNTPRSSAQTRPAQARVLDDATLRLMLTSGNRDAAERAETTLLTRIRGGDPSARPDAATLASAVAAALVALEADPENAHPKAARAAIRLLDRPANDPGRALTEPVRAMLSDRDRPGFAALRRALKRDPAPEVRRLAWRLLMPGPLALACLERLGNAESPAEHNAVLEQAHLLANPARRNLLAALGSPTKPSTRSNTNSKARTDSALAPLLPATTTPLTTRAQLGLASLLTQTRSRTESRTSAVIRERLLTATSPHARLACARLASTADLTDWTLDEHEAVARVAAVRRSTIGVRTPSSAQTADSPRDRHTRLLNRSPHAAVRRIARDDAAQCTLLDDRGMPTVHAITLAAGAPDELAGSFRDMLAEGDTTAAVRAIRAAVRLRLADRLHDQLAEILTTPATTPARARIAATAAAALGSIRTRAALTLAEGAIDRPDPRVRANAVESLETLARALDTARPSPSDRFAEIKHSDEHRARANAVRALERLRLADADETHDDLASMLTDDRSPHRLAGAWLAERMLFDPRRQLDPSDPAWQAVARCVASIARDDTDPHVRARAVRCARRLLDEINQPRAHRRDPAIDLAAKRIRALASAHADPANLIGDREMTTDQGSTEGSLR